MRRLFYLAVGAGVGVAAVKRISRAAQKLTPSGLAGSAGGAISGVGGSVRGFFDEVRFGMAEREIELHEALVGEAPEPYKRQPSEPHKNGRSAS